MSLCISFKKTKSQCPNTSEYAVEFSALPSKFGPGPFSMEDRLVAEDPKSDDPEDLDLLAGRTLTGAIFMPWLTVESAKNQSPPASGGTKKTDEYSSYQLRNSGNRPLMLNNWEKVEDSNPEINIARSNCVGTALPPGSRCILTFRVSPNASKVKKHTSFSTTSADNRLIFTLYANFDEKAEFSVNVKIQ